MLRADLPAADPLASELARYFEQSAPPGIVSAYLHGSHAAARSHDESDVDVGVLVDAAAYPKREARWDLRVRLTSELMGALGTNEIDLVILNDVSPELGRAIINGTRVFCADPQADFVFVRDVQLLAADLVPWLERMRRLHLREILREPTR